MATDTNITPAAPSPMLRKSFTISKSVARATAYICGLGYYELSLNGVKVGDHVLDPAWTRYDYQADYATYDVTTNLVQGANAVGAQLANGFYNQWSTDAWNTYTAPWRALPPNDPAVGHSICRRHESARDQRSNVEGINGAAVAGRDAPGGTL